MLIDFRIFHESNKLANAESAIARMRNATGADFVIRSLEPYGDKGTLVKCQISIEVASWEQLVYRLLQFAQLWGCNWQLGGWVEEEVNMTCSHFHHGQGVSLAVIDISRSELLWDGN